jgi:ArsR family transcriptional regulator
MKDDVYSAVGNAVRAKLLVCLEGKPKNVTNLIANCGLSQSAVSQHLLKLKKSGLVETKKKGKEIWYRLKYNKVAEISKILISLERK